MDESGQATYVGEFRHSVDAKGRLTIPSKWRIDVSNGSETFLALPSPGGFVTVYPPQMIARLKERVASMSLGDRDGQRALALVMSMAHSFGCDKQGRINLNDKLLDHAGIRKEAVLLGMVTRFNIYSPATYAGVQGEATQDNLERIADALAKLGL